MDPGFYARPVAEWEERLDGRCLAVRHEDATRTLDVRVDPLGAYPAYAAEADGVTWVSNSPAALRVLTGDHRVDLDALAGLLGGGWPLGGRPLWAAVLFSLFWIAGMINTVNFLDGMDGLACGVAAIGALILAFVSLRLGQTAMACRVCSAVTSSVVALRAWARARASSPR